MIQHGTVVNGVIVLDAPANLPEGTRVCVELAEDAEHWEKLATMPPEPETYEEHLALLRQSIAAVEAGERGIPADEVFAIIYRELGLDRSDKQ